MDRDDGEADRKKLAVLEAQVRFLINRSSIEDVLKRYSRALDWLDADLLDTVFYDDAKIDYGFFKGCGKDFKPYLLEISAASKRRWHFTSQVSIRAEGDFADVESYNFAVALDDVAPHPNQMMSHFYGFYLDRMEKRAGDWGIISRKHILVSGAFLTEASMSGEYSELNQIGSTQETNLNYRRL